MSRTLVVYVDVDDTFVRSHGKSRIPIPAVIKHIRALKSEGADLYCWSSGGAEYAQNSAEEFEIGDCFLGFLPKPDIAIDDLSFSNWKNMVEVHPNECISLTLADYENKLNANKTKS